MKRILNLLTAGLLLLSSIGHCLPGPLFNIAESGSPVITDLILCLNGKGPASCQHYKSSASTLSISTTISRYYPTAGIKILTPGYTPKGCVPYPNGYCLFAANQASKTPITLTEGDSGGVGGPSLHAVAPNGDGNVSITPNTTQTVNHGTTRGFTVIANNGYTRSSSVGGTCPPGSWTGNVYTTGNIVGDCTVNFSAVSNVPVISISGPSLLIEPMTQSSILVTNIGAVEARNILATLPSGLAAVLTQNNLSCDVINPGQTCRIIFTSTASTPYPLTPITIQAGNSNVINTSINIASVEHTNGNLHALAFDSAAGILYLGGAFTRVGPDIGSGISVDLTTAAPTANSPDVKGTINVVISDGAGGWFIGGDFVAVNQYPNTGLAHILSDGSLDQGFGATPNGPVNALLLNGNRLYVGGAFTEVRNSINTSAIVALNATTGELVFPPFDVQAPAGSIVNTLAFNAGVVYVGGSFSTMGRQPRDNIAALVAANGLATSWNPGADNTVTSMLLNGNTLYTGGTFANIGGAPRSNIAALDITTNTATSWNPGADNSVDAMVLDGTTLYVGGNFTNIGGQARNHIGALNIASNTALAWDPNANAAIKTLALNGSTIYAGGDFTSMGSVPQATPYVAAIDTGTGNPSNWQPNPNNSINSLLITGNSIFLGGRFQGVGGQDRTNLASIDVVTGLMTTWAPNVDGVIESLSLSGSTLYAGGSFSTVNGQAHNNLVAFDTTTGLTTSWSPSTDNNVLSIAINDSTVFVGGDFTTVNAQSRNHLAALNAADGSLLSWNPNANNSINTLIFNNNTVYVGGDFTNIGGQARSYIASIDAGTGIVNASWVSDANATVNALAIDGNNLYAGGSFSNIGGQNRNYIAALDATTGTPTAWNPNINGPVFTLGFFDHLVYVGGLFDRVNGSIRQNVVSIAPGGGANVTSWFALTNGAVQALAFSPSIAFVGGDFNVINIDNTGGFGFAPILY